MRVAEGGASDGGRDGKIMLARPPDERISAVNTLQYVPGTPIDALERPYVDDRYHTLTYKNLESTSENGRCCLSCSAGAGDYGGTTDSPASLQPGPARAFITACAGLTRPD